jgi:sugar phosphate permease
VGPSGGVVAPARYRWVVLAVGTFAQATVSAMMFSVAVLAPELRAHFDLSLSETGVVLAALGIGMTPALLPWGLLTDRVGERVVLPLGLGASALFLARVGTASGFEELVLLLVATGLLSASANAASGRAVMHWFAPSERGLALGIRQSSVPLGGLVAALTLPALAAAAGLGWTYVALAATCLAAALAGAILLRNPAHGPVQAETARAAAGRTLRSTALWRISSGSGLLVMAQTATMSFTVLFLSDARGLSTHAAALALAASQVLGVGFRILAGHLSDRSGARLVPLCRLALAIATSLGVVAALAEAPLWLLVPVIVLAGGVAMSWNGLSFVAAAEIAGPSATGAAIGLQQTMLGIASIAAPIGLAALVAATSWRVGFLAAGLFPVAGWALMAPLARAARPRAVSRARALR